MGGQICMVLYFEFRVVLNHICQWERERVSIMLVTCPRSQLGLWPGLWLTQAPLSILFSGSAHAPRPGFRLNSFIQFKWPSLIGPSSLLSSSLVRKPGTDSHQGGRWSWLSLRATIVSSASPRNHKEEPCVRSSTSRQASAETRSEPRWTFPTF